MRVPPAHTLLAAWDKGRCRHPIDRAVLLHALAEPDAEPDRLADEPLGRMNAALLRLRVATFGAAMCAYLDCPECGSRLEFDLDGAALLASRLDGVAPVVVDGLTFRPPTSRDLAAILGEASGERAALRLLQRCAVDLDESFDESDLEPLLDSVETALERADPLADVTLALRCRACDHAWTPAFDVGAFLWEEIEAYASRLLDEIHFLAGAYGWSEAAILSLSDARRTAYLERVMS